MSWIEWSDGALRSSNWSLVLRPTFMPVCVVMIASTA